MFIKELKYLPCFFYIVSMVKYTYMTFVCNITCIRNSKEILAFRNN